MKIEFNNLVERENIISQYERQGFILVGEQNIKDGNFLLFETYTPSIEGQLVERDKQIAELKTQLTATEQVITENTLAQQELLELLINMGVL